MERLSRGELVVLISGALLLVSAFVDQWAVVDVDFPGRRGRPVRVEDLDAWTSYGLALKLGLVAAIAAVSVAAVRATGAAVELPLTLGTFYAVAGAAALVLLIVSVATGPSEALDPGRIGDLRRGVLVYAGLLLAAGIAAGGWMHLEDEREQAADTQAPPGEASPRE